MQRLKFQITVKRGPLLVTRIQGPALLDPSELTLEEASEKVLQTEAFLEKLTGLRFHIEQVG